jgi:hypothetical protein
MRSPSTWLGAPSSAPRPYWLYAVSYYSTAEQRVTRLFWVGAAAHRLAAKVEQRGGVPRVDRCRLDGPWEEVEPC